MPFEYLPLLRPLEWPLLVTLLFTAVFAFADVTVAAVTAATAAALKIFAEPKSATKSVSGVNLLLLSLDDAVTDVSKLRLFLLITFRPILPFSA